MNTSSQDSALSPLLRWLDQRQDRVAALQGDLTAFRALGPENGGEGELAKALYIEDCLRACGVSDIRRLDAADPRVPSGLRPNVVARIPGRSSRTLWLFAHMDVVPPGDPALWHSDPWQVVRQGDILVGRGVEDNQQGLVSMLLLTEALHACDITPELSLGLVFMADEECGNDYGLAHVLERHAALPEGERFLRADDFYIVPDSGSPTGADIEVAEKCLCWLKVDVSGVQCHASTPHKGRNAFVAGAAAVLACMELHKDFPRRDALFDPACSTFVPSRHDANVPSVNILPGHDTFYVDCRLLPGVEPEHVLDAARRRLTAVAEHHGVRIDVAIEHCQRASETAADSPVVAALRRAVTDIYQVEARPVGIGGATAHAACTTATDTNASAIITVTKSGATPRLISRFRPETPIVACVMDEPVQRQLSLTWGVKPIIMDYVQSTDEMIEGAVSAAQKAGLIHDGEIAVVTAGVPAGIAGTTNMIKVHLVGSSLINGAGVGDENVKGVLCVCRTLEDVRHKFHPGMILVVPHTNNEMLPYIRQAVGVITEENGLGSHAAVVGLSLNKAVIVGAIGATRTLHDGMKVSMDCRQGSVQSLAE